MGLICRTLLFSSTFVKMADGDALFSAIEGMHGGLPWGRFLDAGTGSHSLTWAVRRLKTEEIRAVTADNKYAEVIRKEVRPKEGCVVVGNWMLDENFLAGEKFDVILADYLIGAMHGFSPYRQDEIFTRLSKHLIPGGRIYVVGMEPLPDGSNGASDPGIVAEVARLRDACISLAGHRCYLEFPRSWVEKTLRRSGFTICDSKSFPILHSAHTVEKQLNVARSKLPYFVDDCLRLAMADAIDELSSRVKSACSASPQGRLQLSFDYVIAAEYPGA